MNNSENQTTISSNVYDFFSKISFRRINNSMHLINYACNKFKYSHTANNKKKGMLSKHFYMFGNAIYLMKTRLSTTDLK